MGSGTPGAVAVRVTGNTFAPTRCCALGGRWLSCATQTGCRTPPVASPTAYLTVSRRPDVPAEHRRTPHDRHGVGLSSPDAPRDPHDPRRPHARHVHGRAGPDDRRHVDQDDRRRPQRPLAAGLGHDGIPADGDDLDAPVRQALRHLRAQAALHDRDLAVRGRLPAVRHVELDVRAGRLPRPAGSRRRRPHGAGDHDPRRPRRPSGARSVPGVLPRGVRRLERPRARSSAASSPARRRSSASPAGAGCSWSTSRSASSRSS